MEPLVHLSKWFRFTVRPWLRDRKARLRGRCNRAPMFMVDGGYHFWRCGLKRGHDGPCRTGNYWWGPGGSIYDPAASFAYGADGGAGYQTRRQRESRERWHDLADKRREVEHREAQRAVDAAEEITAESFKPTDGGNW